MERRRDSENERISRHPPQSLHLSLTHSLIQFAMKRLLQSFRYGFAGIAHALRTQANLRIHLSISTAVIIAGFLLSLSNTEWAIIVVTMMIVLAAELFNTSIEAAMDRASPEQHPLVKVAKDTAAGAVLITAIGAVVVGVLIFGPKILVLLFSR